MNESRVACTEAALCGDYGHTSIDRRRRCAHFVYDGEGKTQGVRHDASGGDWWCRHLWSSTPPVLIGCLQFV
ncbi:hypothetical protein E2C01_028841 [Portunus trituberculatus]|uniref:Uncharacterized protein n=1 Tax=Portunus trituberculatus TaxID=210409 RepID=A0A5B7EQK9_PORTR|nr:hypothetical protein [Portunus trituberculatus]